MKCIVCGAEVDWENIKKEFREELDRVDMYGVESLTENLQVMYEGKVCSRYCYENLS